jgi:hypothetical protein
VKYEQEDIVVDSNAKMKKQSRPNITVNTQKSALVQAKTLQSSLFQVHLKDNASAIHLPSVPLTSNKRSLHSFTITNVSNQDLHITLDSDLNHKQKSPSTAENSDKNMEEDVESKLQDRQITFQLANENIEDEEIFENQLFNQVDLIDSLTLKEGETREIIVGFLPKVKPPTYKQVSKIHFSYFQVNGNISIDADTNVYRNSRLPKAQKAHQQLLIPFSAEVCKSFLEVKVNELDFGD